MGLDRCLLAMEENNVTIPINDSIDIYILSVSDSEKETAAYLTQELRINGFIAETDTMNKSLKSQFKSVDRYNSKYLVVLNDEELKNNKITIKDNRTKEEEKIGINDLIDYLDMHM